MSGTLKQYRFRPSSPNPMGECVVFNSGPPGPLSNRKSDSVISDENISSGIVRLLNRVAPLNIVFRITKLIVGPAKRQSRPPTWKHICNKHFKCHPVLCNLYASASIILVVLAVFVETPILHPSPRAVDRVHFSPWRQAVFGASGNHQIMFEATARSDVPVCQIGLPNALDAATDASTFPTINPLALGGYCRFVKSDDREAAECFASDVLNAGGDSFICVFRHNKSNSFVVFRAKVVLGPPLLYESKAMSQS